MTTAPAPAPLLLTSDRAAATIGVSRSEFFRLDSAEMIPAPVEIPSTRGTRPRRLWRSADLAAWVADGCPARLQFIKGRGR